MATISVNGETLHYRLAGSGPALLMIHSLGTNSTLWDRQIAHWQDRFTCIAFDARGHGKSTNAGGVTMKAIAGDLHAALNELGLLPANLIGLSMGGPIAARFYEIDPESVLSIVYADSFASMGGAGEARIADMEAKLASMTMAEYARDYDANTLLPETPAEDHQNLIAAISGMTAEDYLQTVRSIFVEDVRDCLKKITVPLLALAGDSDQRTPVAKAQEVADLVAGAEVKEIPRAGHLANIDNPEGFHAAVDPFLARVR
jgi:3-oxoadipate enol-lactonase